MAPLAPHRSCLRDKGSSHRSPPGSNGLSSTHTVLLGKGEAGPTSTPEPLESSGTKLPIGANGHLPPGSWDWNSCQRGLAFSTFVFGQLKFSTRISDSTWLWGGGDRAARTTPRFRPALRQERGLGGGEALQGGREAVLPLGCTSGRRRGHLHGLLSAGKRTRSSCERNQAAVVKR